MIAKLLISQSGQRRKEEILKLLAFHLLGRRAHVPGGGTNHPDLLYFPDDTKLGIAEARKIKGHFSLKPYSSKGRAVVLENASSLTDEAQNALLKTLEELPEHAIFILAADSDSKLLPTVVSRCQIIHLLNPTSPITPTSEVGYEEVEKLLNSTIEQRFEYIEKLKEKEEFLHALVKYFHQTLASHLGSGNTDYAEFLKELVQTEQWAAQNVNIRAILEYLMLVMPNKL